MSVTLLLRPSTVAGKKSSLYLRFIRKRKSKTVTTPYKVYPEEWNARLSSIRLGMSSPQRNRELHAIALNVNREIEELKNRIHEMDRLGECSPEELANNYRNKRSGILFSDFVRELSPEMELAQQTRLLEAYRSASNNLRSFNQGKELPVHAIDARLVREYEAYMKNKGNEPNTISFYLRNTRAIFNKAIKRGLAGQPRENPFAGAFTGVAKTRKRAVRQETIDCLAKLDLPPAAAGEARRDAATDAKQRNKNRNACGFTRDMFILSFYLRGISFIDMAHLKKTDLSKSSGTISYIRRKTGQRMEIAVTPGIREILRRYAPLCGDTDFLLPILPREASRKQYANALKRQNKHLKALSALAGTDTPLTTYVARHSWASIARAKGFSIAVIAQGLGHESEKTTRIYLDSFDYSILHEANRIITGFTKKAS